MENVKSLAQRINITNKELLSLMQEAGLGKTNYSDEISPEDQKKILDHLKTKRDAKKTENPKILSLNRSPGPTATGTVSVIRKRKAMSATSRSVAELNALHEREKELAQEAQKRRQEQERLDASAQERKATISQKKPEDELQMSVKETEKSKIDQLKSANTRSNVVNNTSAPKASPAIASAQKARGSVGSSTSATRTARSSGKRRTLANPATFSAPVDMVQINDFVRGKKYGKNVSDKDALQSSILTQSFTQPVEAVTKDVCVKDNIQVSELAHLLGIKSAVLVKELMKLGFMVTVNQVIDYETVVLVAAELGHNVVKADVIDVEKQAFSSEQSYPAMPRPPVVTVMGHVDHGKTSLLDYIRRTRVTEQESGGITQHIGAYHVATDKGKISFLDTPGHAAFTSMRARGALLTDIVILVVASDDRVMPQTVEAIKHAESAQVPVVVALNKIDREESDPERLISELSSYDLIPEEWGGDVQFVKISALTGEGVDMLLDAVLLQAELMELKAPDRGLAKGTVIESRLDKARGPMASILVQQGTLKKGDQILAGTCIGRIRAMYDDLGQQLDEVGASVPVEILGLGEVPEAGDRLMVVTDEKAARVLIEDRQIERKKLQNASPLKAIEDAFDNMDGGQKHMNLVVKADTRGSVEAIRHSLDNLETDEIKVNVVMAGAGGITETDISLAHATGSKVVGFHVRADANARLLSEKSGVTISYYSIIYELIEDMDGFLHGMLDPVFEENILGTADVRDIFSASRFGEIAGCMVVDGSILRNKPIRVIRDSKVIYEGELESLRRFKEDVDHVRSGTECGIGVKGYKDVRVGDRIEVFDRIEVDRKTTKRHKHAV